MTMRFVAVKTKKVQGRSVMFRSRELLVRQRTQTINALRGHLAEFGLVAPLGVPSVQKLWEALTENEDILPAPAVSACTACSSRSGCSPRKSRRWTRRSVAS